MTFVRSVTKFRSSGVLFIGHVFEIVLPLVRSIFLAHLLTTTQFGLATALTTVALVIEMFTDLGLDRTVMRAGGRETSLLYRNTLHSVNLIRSLINGVILAFLGPLMAKLFNAPESWLWFTMLGVIPPLRGMVNFEIKQVMQRYIFWREGVAILIAQILWTIVTVAAAFVFHDARCMIFGIVIGQATYVIVTHVTAQFRWRLQWDMGVVREAVAYGVPLIPSSLLASANGLLDRFVVGGFLGPAPLGLYAALTMIQTMPRGFVQRYLNNLAMPHFVNSEHSQADTRTLLFDRWAALSISMAMLVPVGVACFGRPFLFFVYGDKFVPSLLVVLFVAADFVPKFLICIPGTPALALGHSRSVLLYTLISTFGLVTATLTLSMMRTLEGFLGGMVAGDLVSMGVILWLATRAYPFNTRNLWGLLLGSVAIFGTLSAALLTWPGGYRPDVFSFSLHAAFGAGAICAFAGLAVVIVGGLHPLRRLNPQSFFGQEERTLHRELGVNGSAA